MGPPAGSQVIYDRYGYPCILAEFNVIFQITFPTKERKKLIGKPEMKVT
jgi:hypothetical protein